MPSQVKITRRPTAGGAGAPASLLSGQLAFNENTNILYYGTGDAGGGVASSIIQIGGSGATGTWNISTTGNAATATTWQTGRTISLTGDVTGTSVAFNGSANLSFAATLANSGVTAGTYNNSATQTIPFTVDAKGRVTSIGAGVTITPAWSSITSKPTTLSGYGITDAFPSSGGSITSSVDIAGSLRVGSAGTPASTLHIAPANSNSLLVMQQLQNRNAGATAGAGIAFITSATDIADNRYGLIAATSTGAGQNGNNIVIAPNANGTSAITTTTFTSSSTTSTVNITAPTFIGALTGNSSTATTWQTGRTISLTGDVTGTSAAFNGSANLSFATTLANSGVTAGTYNNSATAITPLTVDAKGRVTATGAAVTITPAWASITSKPTTLSGYGITDAAPLASPALTGTPTAPTAAVGTNTTQIATTAFVNSEIANDALLLTGGTVSGNIITTGFLTVGTELNMTGTAGDKYFDLNLDNGTTNYTFNIRTTQNDTLHETALTITRDGAVSLFFDNASKLSTTSTGINVTGQIDSDYLFIRAQNAVSGEGGEFSLAKSNVGSLAGNIIFDINGNNLRIFEGVSPFRGVSVDFTTCGTQSTLWHSGNDGAGSGLDADLWDGYHVSTAGNWSSNGAISLVTGLMSWKHYGNSHVIFDASNSTSPAGGAVDNTNSQVAWVATYPTLMGWNGANTFGVRVDSSRVADSGRNSSFFTASSASEGQIGALFNGQNSAYLYNNSAEWGLYSGSGGAGFRYVRSVDTFYLTSGNRIVIQNSQDGGSNRGIYLWNSGDANWGIYMSTSGAGKSLSGGTACSGISGRTGHFNRYRTFNGINASHLWENSSETCLMELTGNNGDLFLRGSMYVGTSVGGAVTTPPFIGMWNSFSNNTLRANCKIRLYDNGAGDVYGFGIGSNGDVQYHSVNSHAFYNNDVLRLLITGSTITYSGNTVWHAGNDGAGSGLDADLLDGINSSSFARVDSTSNFTVPTLFQSDLGTTSGSLSNPPLQAYSTGGNAAFMSFHRAGLYAVNFGLDSDNVLRIGGWSAAANRWQLDMSGNMTIPGTFTSDTSGGNQLLLHAGSSSNTPTLIHRNDGTDYYLLMSNASTSVSGAWNALRPFKMNLTNGTIDFGHIINFYGDVVYTHPSGSSGGDAISFLPNANATSVVTTIESPRMRYTARYWTGTASANTEISTYVRTLNNGAARYIWSSAGTEVAILTQNGRLRLGDGGVPAYDLQLMADSAGKPSTTTWTVTSDERIKEDIELANLDICYENVKNLPLKRYKWREDVYTHEQVPDRRKLGWIAQDVQAIMPKAVSVNEFTFNTVKDENGEIISEDKIEDCLSLNTDQIIASLYGAVQKLMGMVENLVDRVTQLESHSNLP